MTIFHSKFKEVKILIDHSIPVMLTGEKGSGKTTLIKQVAEALELEFFSMSMTRQTTLSLLLGFRSIDGNYIPSELRRAVESGGVFLLDEIDAADPNVLLALNTIENGYVSFPDGIVYCHKDFRLAATANPQNEHHHYTGRTKLDAATLDRFDIININRDLALEASLVSANTLLHIDLIRDVLKRVNSDIVISMRDSLRYQKRSDLNLLEGFVEKLMGNETHCYDMYKENMAKLPKYTSQSECKTLNDLITLLRHT